MSIDVRPPHGLNDEGREQVAAESSAPLRPALTVVDGGQREMVLSTFCFGTLADMDAAIATLDRRGALVFVVGSVVTSSSDVANFEAGNG